MRLDGRTVVVGLSGGIACYKACEVVRGLVQGGARVHVAMTRGAQEFVAPLTFQTLSGRPVATDTFSLTQESEIGHIRLADEAEVVLVAPATANVLAKLAAGDCVVDGANGHYRESMARAARSRQGSGPSHTTSASTTRCTSS